MFCRRSKYMDFFICALFVVLLVYAYFSRRVLLDKLRREEEERLKLEHNANSLKEELKIVYYHTSKLEEALKAEQDRHKSTNSRLSSQSFDFKLNMTTLQKQYAVKLKEKSESIKTYVRENEELKEKHKLVEKHFSELAETHKTTATKIKLDYDNLKHAKDEESLRLQDEIQETYNQKVYFQKKAVLNEDDYKKTLKKLARCKSILSRRNATISSNVHKTAVNTVALSQKKISGKKNDKTKPAEVSSKFAAKPLPLEPINKFEDQREVLPTEKVILQNSPSTLPTEKRLNQHNLPTEKLNSRYLGNKFDSVKHDVPETTDKVSGKNVSDNGLIDNPSVVENNVNNKINIDQVVESPVNLPVVVSRKLPEEKTHTSKEINPEGDPGSEAGMKHGPLIVKEIESEVTTPRLLLKDNT